MRGLESSEPLYVYLLQGLAYLKQSSVPAVVKQPPRPADTKWRIIYSYEIITATADKKTPVNGTHKPIYRKKHKEHECKLQVLPITTCPLVLIIIDNMHKQTSETKKEKKSILSIPVLFASLCLSAAVLVNVPPFAAMDAPPSFQLRAGQKAPFTYLPAV